jgi:hypothetical protein
VVVNPSVPAKTIPEFIAYAKANPGKLNLASPGSGGTPHLAGVLFNMMTGVDMVHVPYRSTAALITDLLSGQVQVFFGTTAAVTEYIRAGAVRALAATTAVRSEALPDIPTVAEFVPGYESSAWYGIGAEEYGRRDRGQAQHGNQCVARRSQVEGAVCRPGRRHPCRLACRLRKADRRGDRKMGQGRQVLWREGGGTSPALNRKIA